MSMIVVGFRIWDLGFSNYYATDEGGVPLKAVTGMREICSSKVQFKS